NRRGRKRSTRYQREISVGTFDEVKVAGGSDVYSDSPVSRRSARAEAGGLDGVAGTRKLAKSKKTSSTGDVPENSLVRGIINGSRRDRADTRCRASHRKQRRPCVPCRGCEHDSHSLHFLREQVLDITSGCSSWPTQAHVCNLDVQRVIYEWIVL